MTSELKNQVSHRGKAGRALVKYFQEKLRPSSEPVQEAFSDK